VRAVLLALIFLAPPTIAADTVLSPSGEIDPVRIAELIDFVSPSIREYPVRFKDAAQRAAVIEAMRKAATDLTEPRVMSLKDPELATDVALVLAMGHNLDLGTANLAHRTYALALRIHPDSRRANYFYGMFLLSTATGQARSLQYLQRAFDLGEEGAEYPIGLCLIGQGKKDEGLERLEHFSERFPEDAQVKKIIEAVKNGNLRFNKSDG
jgi:hypothetical protein